MNLTAVIIGAIIAVVVVIVAVLAYTFDWSKLPKKRAELDDVKTAAAIGALALGLSEAERRLKVLDADADERDRHMTRLTHLVNDKVAEFDSLIKSAEAERSALVRQTQSIRKM